MRIAAELLARGFFALGIRPPTVPGRARNASGSRCRGAHGRADRSTARGTRRLSQNGSRGPTLARSDDRASDILLACWKTDDSQVASISAAGRARTGRRLRGDGLDVGQRQRRRLHDCRHDSTEAGRIRRRARRLPDRRQRDRRQRASESTRDPVRGGRASVEDADGTVSTLLGGPAPRSGGSSASGDMTGDGRTTISCLVCDARSTGTRAARSSSPATSPRRPTCRRWHGSLAGRSGLGRQGRTLAVGDVDDDGVDDAMLGAPYVDAGGGGSSRFGPIDARRRSRAGDVRLYGDPDSYRVPRVENRGTSAATASRTRSWGRPGYDDGRRRRLRGERAARRGRDRSRQPTPTRRSNFRGQGLVRPRRSCARAGTSTATALRISSCRRCTTTWAAESGTVAVVLGPVGRGPRAHRRGRRAGRSQPFAEAGFALEMADVDGDGKDDASSVPARGTDAARCTWSPGPPRDHRSRTVATVIEGTSIEPRPRPPDLPSRPVQGPKRRERTHPCHSVLSCEGPTSGSPARAHSRRARRTAQSLRPSTR
jgi:hypothetical protein